MRRRFLTLGVCTALACTAMASSAFATDSIAYTYDVFGRVTSATYSTGVVVTYTYDNAGNRTQKVITGGTGAANSPPTAVDDTGTALQSSGCGFPTAFITPLSNDTDPDGDTLTVTGASGASSGTLTFTTNSITYHYSGRVCQSGGGFLTIVDSDTFSYTISDGHGHTATANVNINIESF